MLLDLQDASPTAFVLLTDFRKYCNVVDNSFHLIDASLAEQDSLQASTQKHYRGPELTIRRQSGSTNYEAAARRAVAYGVDALVVSLGFSRVLPQHPLYFFLNTFLSQKGY